MGKWLAEFQENPLETDIQTTDSTDTSHLLSVLSVRDQGILKEKAVDPELMARISGELSAGTLKDYARQIDEAINNGVVNLILERINRECR